MYVAKMRVRLRVARVRREIHRNEQVETHEIEIGRSFDDGKRRSEEGTRSFRRRNSDS